MFYGKFAVYFQNTFLYVSIAFTFATYLSDTVFLLTTTLFTTLLSLLKSTGTVFNLPTPVLYISSLRPA